MRRTILLAVLVLVGTLSVSIQATSALPGYSVEGTVRTTGGASLAGATVEAFSLQLPHGGTDVTDADGNYRIDDLNRRSYTVTACASGYVCASQSVAVTGEITGVDFALPIPATITGTVVDPRGAPIQNISVGADDGESQGVLTDANGAFVITGLPPGTHTVSACDGAYVPIYACGDRVVSVGEGEAVVGLDFQLFGFMPDQDFDGCTTFREAVLGFDKLNPWDVYDVLVPAYRDATPNGPRDRVVNIGDVLAVLTMVGAERGNAMYDIDN